MSRNWKHRAAQRIRRMSPEDAQNWLDRFRAEGVTAFHDTVRELTGGYTSQTITSVVRRMVAEKVKGDRA